MKIRDMGGDIEMKQVVCSSLSCPNRRVHYVKPDVPRGPQYLWVPHDHGGPWYCSIECSIYGNKELPPAHPIEEKS